MVSIPKLLMEELLRIKELHLLQNRDQILDSETNLREIQTFRMFNDKPKCVLGPREMSL